MVVRWRLRSGEGRGAGRPPGLRERCEQRVRALGLPRAGALTVDDVCEHISSLHGRPIHLMALELPVGSPDGLWVSAENADYVVFERRLAPVHQQQVILHEIGHLVCDHEAAPVLSADSSRLLLPSLDPEMVRRTLGREHEHSDVEMEAELVGSLIGRHISSWTAQRPWSVPPEAQELAARLAALQSPTHRGRNE
ncbi:regulator component [Streptomyces sp. NPDC049555]|uniref:regulator component n=1 Tax=unclassified Streptomyces TaxID=2593676 RepID=UPI0034238B73